MAYKTLRRLGALLMTTMLFASCQPRPEQGVIVGKGEQSAAPSALPSMAASQEPQGEEHWEERFAATTGKFQIIVDAPVYYQGMTTGREYTVTMPEFSKEQIDAVFNVLVGDRAIYSDEKGVETKEALEEDIIYAKSLLSTSSDEMERERLEQSIKVSEEFYQKAPAADEIRKGALSRDVIYQKNGFVLIENGTPRFDSFFVKKGDVNNIQYSSNAENIMYSNEHEQEQPARGMEMSREEAIQLGLETLEQMGLTDYYVAQCNVADDYIYYLNVQPDSPKQCYKLRIFRNIGGVPINGVTRSNGLTESEEGLVRRVSGSESIIMDITDNGVEHFDWSSPFAIQGEPKELGALMPFEQIKERFRTFMMAANTDIVGGWVEEVHIDEIRLGWMLVAKKDSSTELRVIPVWDFFGYNVVKDPSGRSKREGEAGYSQLTINAVDGSIINRVVGY